MPCACNLKGSVRLDRRALAPERRALDGTGAAFCDCMTDLVFIVATVAFFALSAAYVRGCDRL
jgi:hypothetical protein